MTDEPFDLDKHRGMAAQKATDLRRALAEVESSARNLRDRQARFRKSIAVAASYFLAGCGRQGALCLESLCRGIA